MPPIIDRGTFELMVGSPQAVPPPEPVQEVVQSREPTPVEQSIPQAPIQPQSVPSNGALRAIYDSVESDEEKEDDRPWYKQLSIDCLQDSDAPPVTGNQLLLPVAGLVGWIFMSTVL